MCDRLTDTESRHECTVSHKVIHRWVVEAMSFKELSDTFLLSDVIWKLKSMVNHVEPCQ